jgi:hypothetical protein
MGDIHWLPAAISTVVGFFLLGGLWYSKALFGFIWSREAGFVDEQGNWKGVPPGEKPKHKHAGRVFALSFLFAFVAAIAFSLLLPAAYTLTDALVRGVVVGAGIAATSFGINYQFGQRTTLLWLIDAGYHTLQFTIYGLVFGLFA